MFYTYFWPWGLPLHSMTKNGCYFYCQCNTTARTKYDATLCAFCIIFRQTTPKREGINVFTVFLVIRRAKRTRWRPMTLRLLAHLLKDCTGGDGYTLSCHLNPMTYHQSFFTKSLNTLGCPVKFALRNDRMWTCQHLSVIKGESSSLFMERPGNWSVSLQSVGVHFSPVIINALVKTDVDKHQHVYCLEFLSSTLISLNTWKHLTL